MFGDEIVVRCGMRDGSRTERRDDWRSALVAVDPPRRSAVLSGVARRRRGWPRRWQRRWARRGRCRLGAPISRAGKRAASRRKQRPSGEDVMWYTSTPDVCSATRRGRRVVLTGSADSRGSPAILGGKRVRQCQPARLPSDAPTARLPRRHFHGAGTWCWYVMLLRRRREETLLRRRSYDGR